MGLQPFPTSKANPSPQACPWSELTLHRHGAPTWPARDTTEPCPGPSPHHLMKPLVSLRGPTPNQEGGGSGPQGRSVFHSDLWVLRGGWCPASMQDRALSLYPSPRCGTREGPREAPALARRPRGGPSMGWGHELQSQPPNPAAQSPNSNQLSHPRACSLNRAP